MFLKEVRLLQTADINIAVIIAVFVHRFDLLLKLLTSYPFII